MLARHPSRVKDWRSTRHALDIAAYRRLSADRLEISKNFDVVLTPNRVVSTPKVGRPNVVTTPYEEYWCQNGLVVTDTSQFLQQVLIGVTLIAAVAIDDTFRQTLFKSSTNTTKSGIGKGKRQKKGRN